MVGVTDKKATIKMLKNSDTQFLLSMQRTDSATNPISRVISGNGVVSNMAKSIDPTTV